VALSLQYLHHNFSNSLFCFEGPYLKKNLHNAPLKYGGSCATSSRRREVTCPSKMHSTVPIGQLAQERPFPLAVFLFGPLFPENVPDLSFFQCFPKKFL
jgi:hypothetical protein